MNFHIITLFQDSMDSYLNESVIARAIKNKKISVNFYNPRDFVKPTKFQSKKDKPYLRVDDKPYGGGPGMVMQALPVIKAIESALIKIKKVRGKVKILSLSPSGKMFENRTAEQFKKYDHIIIICGRYEGIDHRVNKIFKTTDISIGNYTLTGGELPAMVIIDAISRRIDGVLGNNASIEENRVSSSRVYTRPEALIYKGKKYSVPKVLLSGNHKKINDWREKV